VRLDLFREGPTGWSTDLPGGEPLRSGDWFDPDVPEVTGDGVLRLVDDAVVFDHRRVRIEVEDGGDPKRWPVWGDAAHLIDMLAVRPRGDGTYESVTRGSHGRTVVEASQVLGQAIVAAGRHVPGRRAVSAHLVMMRPAADSEPLTFAVDELTGGRTFSTVRVDVTQGGRPVATATLLLDVTAPDLIRHEAEAPAVAGPDDALPHDMGVTGRDLRVVDGAYTGDPEAPVGPPVIDAWVRFRGVPDDPYVHAGLLAQFTGHMSIAAALRPHAGVGQAAAHVTLSTAINAIHLSLHGDVRADEWMLYRHLSTFAGGGMTHSECRVHAEDGRLLASFSVDAMVRAFEGGTRVDHRTTM
jgi:acyl-CoA thioesterase-2